MCSTGLCFVAKSRCSTGSLQATVCIQVRVCSTGPGAAQATVVHTRPDAAQSPVEETPSIIGLCSEDSELLLDVSTPVVSTLQRPVLHLDVSAGLALHLDLS